MSITRYIARQLGNPSGRFGRAVMTRLLNRGNDELISGALATLMLARDDRFIDVGFGGGVALAKAARVVSWGRLYGADRSQDMVCEAQRRFRDWVACGRLRLDVADASGLPYPDASMDKVLTTNTVYFWPDVAACLGECVRVLAPGGRIAIGISGADKMRAFGPVTSHGFRFFEGPELADILTELGLVDTAAVALHGRHSYGDFVIVGRKAADPASEGPARV